ncbi:SDR family oxidoreductase, partial [Streptomyces sioyaensis]|uniref:SDR family oxidoreductase n=1 Tax=Streptomyces sioyaensis TaxID=67364 RepID=UPI0037949178
THTLQTGHPQHPHRHIIIANTTTQATTLLQQPDPALVFSDRVPDERHPLVFLFSGVGDHYPGMAAALYRQEPSFRDAFDTCAEELKVLIGLDITEVFDEGTGEPGDHAGAGLHRTRVAQPLAFALNYALARLYMHYGAEPTAVAGYSVGEYVAACVAGVLPLRQALSLVARRAELIDALPGGAMLAVLTDAETLTPYLDALPGLCFGALDGPMLTVVSGPDEPVAALAERLTADGIASRTLPTSHAFHSPMMEPAADALRALAADFELSPPRIPVLSNVTGDWLTEEEATDPGYFARHLTQPVRFADNIDRIWRSDTAPVVVEIGPGQVLTSLAMQHPARAAAPGGLVLPSLPGRIDAADDLTTLRTTLGRLWLRGVGIRWDAGSDGAGERRRIVLPTVAFQRERYWLDAGTRTAPERRTASPSGRRADPGDWFYLPSWQRSLPAAPADDPARPCLVLAADPGFGTALASTLRQDGTPVLLALHTPGQSVTQTADGTWVFDAARPQEFTALIDALDAEPDDMPQRVVSALAVGPESGPADTGGVRGLLYLAQALAGTAQVGTLELTVVTSGAYALAGESELSPARAMLGGASRVLAQELPHVRTRTVDVAAVRSPQDVPAVVELLAAEVRAAPADPCVALRGAHRWVQTFEPVHLDDDDGRTAVRADGTYLLIGGLGPVGQVVARQLAAVPGVKLAFAQRTPLPSRDSWVPGEDERVDFAMAGLADLQERGARVLTVTADLTDAAAMAAAMERVEEEFGPLNGVVHSAGMVNEGAAVPLLKVDEASCAQHFAAKVEGLHVLAGCLEGKPLDFVLLNSSIASVLGGIGYFPYAAANCHMDAFAQREQERTGVPWATVNWEGWVLGDSPPEDATAATLAAYLIDDDAGQEVISRVLANPLTSQLVVSTGSLGDRIAQWVTGAWHTPTDAPQESPAEQTLHARPALQTAYREPGDELERTLGDMWQQLLGIDQVGMDDSFFALGGHSLIATRVVARISEQLGVHVPLHELLTHPTVAGLAALVRDARGRAAGRQRSTAITAVSRERYRVGSDSPVAGGRR